MKNFNISSGDSAGIFSFNKGNITNLKIKNASINVSTKNSGIISGYNWGVSETKGLIGDCELDGVIISFKIYGSESCGAIAGQNYGGKITNCTVTNVTINAAYSGGIVGVNNNWDGQTAEIAGCNVDNASIEGNIYCGGIAGTNLGDIKYSPFNSGKVKTDNQYCGGIAGLMKGGTINGCTSAGTVEGTDYVGGIVGSVLITRNGDHSIANCNYKGKSISGQNYVGGLIGSIGFYEDFGNNVSLTIDGCSTEGDVYVEGTSNVGGLVGYVYGNSSGIEGKGSVIITNSHARLNVNDGGKTDVKGRTIVGGLIGCSQGEVSGAVIINRCYAMGDINATNPIDVYGYAGGLIGSAIPSSGRKNNSVTISECFSCGTVIAQNYSGGLIGSTSYSEITYCYSTSKVLSSDYTGGLVGNLSSYSTIRYCYALGDVTNYNESCGGLVGFKEDTANADYSFRKSMLDDNSALNGVNTHGWPRTLIELKTFKTYEDLEMTEWYFGISATWSLFNGNNNGFPWLTSNPHPL